MNKSALVELIRNGENSGVEFKRDDLRPERLATEIAALLNLEGGRILLGVEDNGSVAGLTREPRKVEEWVGVRNKGCSLGFTQPSCGFGGSSGSGTSSRRPPIGWIALGLVD